MDTNKICDMLIADNMQIHGSSYACPSQLQKIHISLNAEVPSLSPSFHGFSNVQGRVHQNLNVLTSPTAPAAISIDRQSLNNPIRTLVFFDTETTGLPAYDFNRTRIVELALVACSVEHIRSMRQATPQEQPPPVPRVLHKLTVCLNPFRPIEGGATLAHRLDNTLLEHEQPFDAAAGRLMVEFLNRLQKPVCLVAYNGDYFDFPILRKQLLNIGSDLGADLRCVDAMLLFQRIDELHDVHGQQPDMVDTEYKCSSQCQDWELSQKPKKRAKKMISLTDVHERLFDALPEQAHHAEGDAMAMLRCVCRAREQFLALLDDESKLFADVVPKSK